MDSRQLKHEMSCDLVAGTTELISRTALGASGDGGSGDCINGPSVAMDGTGTLVAFASYAEDLDAADGGTSDIYVSRPAPLDADADGITDDIDTAPGVPSTGFSDGTTFGQIVSVPAGFSVMINDATATEEGVRVVVTGSGIQKVQLSMCGGLTVRLPAGADAVLTCGSVIVAVAAGSPPVEVVIGGGLAVVSVPAGAQAEVDATPSGSFTVTNVIGGTISVTVDGTTSSVPPGQSVNGNAWDFQGFNAPVDNNGVVNKTLRLNIGDGVFHTAQFEFTR